ncbi:MAG: RNA polymerase factor sigma-32 [Bdellovibrionaceae bacterium]|nr:RNA polymerase factor sigma-32 [Pseudobdellovibrionaceae bacterium]
MSRKAPKSEKQPKAKPSGGGARSKKTHRTPSRVVTAEIVEEGEQPKFFDADLVPSNAAEKAIVPTALPIPSTTDPLTLYLAEIRKYPVLSREEEEEIAKKYFETRDARLAETLVKSNLRFVVKIAAEYSRFGAKMIDLIQEGNIGLMQAVKEFNPYKGTRLITYAVWWIRGYIQEYLMRQHSVVRIGTTQNQRKLFYQLRREKAALDKMTSPENVALLSEKLGIPHDEVAEMAKRMAGRDISLDRPVDEDSGETIGTLRTQGTVEPPDETIAREEEIELLRRKIDEVRPHLNERELILLEERLLNDEPLTLQEIGEKYGITREAVRQAEVRLLKKIRERLETSAKKN